MLGALIDIALHLDQHLLELVRNYGVWVHGILFVIIFSETGFVVTPFLPGDSLLFVAGTLCAAGHLDIAVLLAVLTAAAILGNQVNFLIGRALGLRIAGRGWLRREHVLRTEAFFARHGGKTIVLSRFVPIVRTYAPFVAGLSRMPPLTFAWFNCVGGALWVGSLVLSGYFLGNLPLVRDNLTLVLLAIVVASVLPAIFEAWRGARPKPGSADD